jgi:hypothetical protein
VIDYTTVLSAREGDTRPIKADDSEGRVAWPEPKGGFFLWASFHHDIDTDALLTEERSAKSSAGASATVSAGSEVP